MNDFVEYGSTSPAPVLTRTSTIPSARRQRRAQISSRASLHAADQRIFFFLGCSAIARAAFYGQWPTAYGLPFLTSASNSLIATGPASTEHESHPRNTMTPSLDGR